MIAIIDGGSTKSDWIIINTNSKTKTFIKSKGLNPAISSEEALLTVLSENKDLTQIKQQLKHIYYYGAGCGTERPKQALKKLLESFFNNAAVNVYEDSHGAVYATTPHQAGVVCILGTGSNCVYYDGKSVQQRIKSLGYSVMDDASGNYFGKQLLRDYFFNNMPKSLQEHFKLKYDLDEDVIKYNLYKVAFPNAYLAHFAAFMFEHYEHEYVKALLKRGLNEFADSMLKQYENELKTVNLHFVGSIASLATAEVQALAKSRNFKLGNIIKQPISGLVNYHLNLVI